MPPCGSHQDSPHSGRIRLTTRRFDITTKIIFLQKIVCLQEMSFVSLTTPIGANLLDEDGNGHRSGQIHVNGSDAGVVFFTDLEGNVLLKFTFREPGTRHILRHYSVDGARMIAASFYIRYNLREDGLISLRNLVLRSSVIPENRGT